MQTYFMRDIVRLVVEVKHDTRLANCKAKFLRVMEAEEVSGPFPLELPATEIDEVSRAGTAITSRVTFELELDRNNCLPGEYELDVILGYPPEGGPRFRMELDEPNVRFRVVQVPAEPSGRVTDHRLELGNRRQQLSP